MIAFIARKFLKKTSLSSLEVYDSVIHKCNNFLKLIGSDLFSETFKYLNVRLGFLVMDIVSYIAININSMLVFKDDFVKMIFCLVTV